jgi:hypothetical protein
MLHHESDGWTWWCFEGRVVGPMPKRDAEQLRDAIGRPPWYTWPFLILPLFLSLDYFAYSAILMLVLGIVELAAGAYWLAAATFGLAAVLIAVELVRWRDGARQG